MRDSFGSALVEACAADERLFVLDGDCSHSTRSGWVQEKLGRSFRNVGIAEQNMVGMAAGLALAGLRPVVSGFASIVMARAAEQVLLSVALPDLPVTFAGHYAGVSAALEGAPHHAITDLAFLRAVPNMQIYVPSDDAEAAALAGRLSEVEHPRYIRLCRDPVEPIPGGRRLSEALRVWPVENPRVLLVCCGVAVGPCVRAAERLAAEGVPATVAAVTRIKPFPALELCDLAHGAQLAVSVEEHSVIGGLGGATAESFAESGGPRLLRLGLPDTFTETGPYRELLARYGIEAGQIARQALAALESSRRSTL